MMNKLYIEGNYLIIDEAGLVRNFPIKSSSYSLVSDPDGYSIDSYGRDSIVILTADIFKWFDEAGAIAFTEASLIVFLRLNTGF
tara:strand:+ start:219 stop:470 length:252 start_codon:yes stop_codon:yes gene_type:complete